MVNTNYRSVVPVTDVPSERRKLPSSVPLQAENLHDHTFVGTPAELQNGHAGAASGSSSEDEDGGLRDAAGAVQADDGSEDSEEDEGTAAERRCH